MLNEQQIEAALHQEGPCLVLAGAGSGKTRVLTQRIEHLISTGVSPHNILAITFTNKAAREMRNRLEHIGGHDRSWWIQTFHAACNRILRMDIDKLGFDRSFTILDDAESKGVVKALIKEAEDHDSNPDQLAYLIKQAKNDLAGPERFFLDQSMKPGLKERYLGYYRQYVNRLKSINCLDFEDLITLCIRLFRECPEVLEKYRDWFRFIMIDEYQDTNHSQYLWASLLAARDRNIFVVGDPDQSIYSWRGADPGNIRRFRDDYPEARVVKLEKNYRSTRKILQAANAVIRHNAERDDKSLRTDNPDGHHLHYFCASNGYQEADFIADTIRGLVSKGIYQYRDFAVFFRTHVQSRVLEESMLGRRVPYQILGGTRFYQRKEIKDILAYLRLACNPHDTVSFRRVINVPRRGIGEKTMSRLSEYAEANGLPVLEALSRAEEIPGIGQKISTPILAFYGLISFYRNLADAAMPVSELIQQVIESSGYLEELKKSEHDFELRMENLEELMTLAIEFERESQEGEGLAEFLAGVALFQDTDEEARENSVSLMTMHGAKGLEFPVVFISGLEEGLFPSYRIESAQEMEEERRLCYVAITRARERLYMSSAMYRVIYGNERFGQPSRFIKEIPGELFEEQMEIREKAELAAGDRVQHNKFGEGVVLNIQDEDIISVDFDSFGVKQLRLEYARLVKI